MVIFLYVLISLIADSLLGIFSLHASVIISIFAIIEYAFFSAFFYFTIRNKNFKKLIILISILDLIYEFYLFYLLKTNFDFWIALITTILVLLYCIFFFYEEISLPQSLIIYQSSSFWVATGCMIYLSGTLFLFLYTADLKDKQNSSLWIINIVFEIIKNVFFSIAFIIGRNSKKNNAPADVGDTNMFENPF